RGPLDARGPRRPRAQAAGRRAAARAARRGALAGRGRGRTGRPRADARRHGRLRRRERRVEARVRARAAERRLPRLRRGREEEAREGVLTPRAPGMRSFAGILLSPVGLAPVTATAEAFRADVTAAAGPKGLVETLVHDGDPREKARLVSLFASP